MRSGGTVRDGWRSHLHTRALAVVLIAGAGVAGCMPQPATTQGRTIFDLYSVFFVAAAVVAAIVWGLITWSIVRYRRPTGPGDSLPPQVRGNIVLEVVWTGLPILTVLGLFGLTFVALNQVDARSPDPGVNVHVEAFQWQWRFTYPDEGVTITGLIDQPPQLVVPVGQPVHVLLTSSDVNHAFFVPAFLFKRDAIPGHPNAFDFTVMNPGVYGGQCAEFCGVFHDRMLFSVRAVSPTDFRGWLASAQASTASGSGGSAPRAPGSSPAASPATSSPSPSASPS